MIKIRERFSLQAYNSLLINKRARYFCEVNRIDDCKEVVEFIRSKRLKNFILGEGTNIVLTKDFNGLVVKNNIKEKSNKGYKVLLGGGENWHQSVLWTLNKQLFGLENLALIPGTVGAAPVQNIGAYGVELSSAIESIEAINLKNGEVIILTNKDCKFGYRESIFKGKNNPYLITSIKLNLHNEKKVSTDYQSLVSYLLKDDIDPKKATPFQICRAVVSIRNSILPNPKEKPNVGSFFKNLIINKDKFKKLQMRLKDVPFFKMYNGKYKIPTAYLIEKAGWKGYKENSVSVSEDHALVFIASRKSNTEDILSLSSKISEDIRSKYDVDLEIEPTIC